MRSQVSRGSRIRPLESLEQSSSEFGQCQMARNKERTNISLAKIYIVAEVLYRRKGKPEPTILVQLSPLCEPECTKIQAGE